MDCRDDRGFGEPMRGNGSVVFPHPPPPAPRPAALSRCGAMFGDLFFGAILLFTTAFDLAQLRLLDRSMRRSFRSCAPSSSPCRTWRFTSWRIAGAGGAFSRLAPRRSARLLFVAVMVSTLPSALMVGALSYGLMALIGFTLGRGRMPWLPLAALAGMALFLQGGKEAAARQVLVWRGGEATRPGRLPGACWRTGFAFPSIRSARIPARPRRPTRAGAADESQSLLQRASLLQLFLRIQQMSPDPGALPARPDLRDHSRVCWCPRAFNAAEGAHASRHLHAGDPLRPADGRRHADHHDRIRADQRGDGQLWLSGVPRARRWRWAFFTARLRDGARVIPSSRCARFSPSSFYRFRSRTNSARAFTSPRFSRGAAPCFFSPSRRCGARDPRSIPSPLRPGGSPRLMPPTPATGHRGHPSDPVLRAVVCAPDSLPARAGGGVLPLGFRRRAPA